MNDTDTAHYKLLNNRVINKTTCYYPIIIRPTASERLANGTYQAITRRPASANRTARRQGQVVEVNVT